MADHQTRSSVLTEVGKKDECISPSVREVDVEWSVELVADSELTVPASRRIRRVVEVSAKHVHKALSPGRTGLAAWGIENGELVSLTADDQAAGGNDT